jgi:CBS domain-containing protein
MDTMERASISRATPLRDVMTRQVITIQQGTRTSAADTLMKHHPIHHLPVLEGKRLRGLISQSDLYRNMLSLAFVETEREQHDFLDRFLTVESIMTADPITLSPEDTLGRAIDLMVEYRIGCIPVVDGMNELQGILTDFDLLRIFSGTLR